MSRRRKAARNIFLSVVYSVSNELTLPIDQVEYGKAIEESSDQALEALQKFRTQVGL
jgi:hypothetical protein